MSKIPTVKEVQVGYGFKEALYGGKIGNLKSQYSIRIPKKEDVKINFMRLLEGLPQCSGWKKILKRY